jgi:hypothetical protein
MHGVQCTGSSVSGERTGWRGGNSFVRVYSLFICTSLNGYACISNITSSDGMIADHSVHAKA